VLRALAREKADRWPTAKDFAKALATQCANLMFDQEQRSAFMREHFDDQMNATAALLGSVSDTPSKQLVLAKAVKAIRGDGGAMSNAKPMSRDEAKVARNKPRRRDTPPNDSDLELAMLQGKAEALGTGPSAPPPSLDSAKTGTWLMPSALVAGLLLLGLALYKVAFSDAPASTADLPVYMNAVPIPHAAAAPPAAGAGGGPAVEPTAAGADTGASKKDDPSPLPAPKPKAPTRMGQVTLVTFPNAKVYRGKVEIGTTPLFNADLPLGTHLLTLVGPDNVKHVLSVRVADGKNTAMKVNLDELPTR
jgi:serine/threonine-protein kinase